MSNLTECGTIFKQEYDSIWYGSNNRYDTPIYTIEKDCTKIMLYELIGLSEEMLKIETEFINKTKETYININGEFEDKLTGWKNNINIHQRIDTEVYSYYDCNIKDGILTIILHEIINERPTFFKSVPRFEF